MDELNDPLDLELESAKKGHSKLQLHVHNFPAAYILYHVGSGMFYVGSTRNMYHRAKGHLNSLRVGMHRTIRFQKAYDEHENKNILVSFIKAKDREHAFDLEQKLLDRYLPTGKLFNSSPDARISNKGVPVTNEQKEILRKKATVQFSDPSAREKQAELSRRKWLDPVFREKQIARSDIRSDKNKQNLHAAVLKAWADPVSRQKLLAERATRRKPISIDGKIYASIKEAHKTLGISESTIFGRVNSISEQFKTWIYHSSKGNIKNGSN